MNIDILARIFGSDSNYAKQPLAFVISLLLALNWATWYVVSRWGVTSTLTPGDIMLIRFVVGTVLGVPFFFMWKNEKVAWKSVCVMVPTYGVIYLSCLFYGFKTTPVANAGILINGTLPLINGLLAVLIFKGSISRIKWVAIFLLLLANACMFIAGINDASLTWGWALILLGAISIGTYMTVLRQSKTSYYVAIPLLSIFNLVLFLPVFPFLESNLAQASMVEIISQGIVQGVLNQVVILYLFAYTIQRLGSVSLSVVLGTVPALTAIMGWMFLSESVVLLEMIGIAGCTIGIVLFGRSK